MKLNDPFVITISREVGSGGRTIGRKLAAKLAVHYSDKQLIDSLKEKFNLTASGIEKLKGEKKNWLADFIQFVAPVPKYQTLAETDGNFAMEFRPEVSVKDVYEAEKAILNSIADEGSCVIAGRSGFFVLKDRPNKVDIFITAPLEQRIARVMTKQGLTREQAETVIESLDKTRDNYIQRYTGVSRYDARNYNLVINMDHLTEDEAVDLILEYLGA
ncbi:MAG: cytidylate kinase-like family protein [Bacteroidales bacterium]|nr:cytidylate kinase-like family protein [Bacteroidales bacterium]